MKRVVLAISIVYLVSLFGCGGSVSQKPSARADKQQTPSESKPANLIKSTSEPDDSNPKTGTEVALAEAKVRKFIFHYRFVVKGLQPAEDSAKSIVRVWLPCPSNSDFQEIKRLEATAPDKLSENTESRYGNRVLFFQISIPESGEFTVDVPYEVIRREVLRGASPKGKTLVEELSADKLAVFLGADRMVPTTGKPLKLIETLKLPKDKLGLARQLYDVVDDHVIYKKEGTQWGRGDSNWVCDSGFGNCTDFHSLFISLARSQGLPARFEMGFSIPTDKSEGPIAGYHCWAWFHTAESGWVPVDISEADKNPKLKDYYFGNLTADRVMFSIGRDLELTPKAEHQPLNFFVYPHIEVGGKVLPTENIERQFSFMDEQ